jgi:hypothetical protein
MRTAFELGRVISAAVAVGAFTVACGGDGETPATGDADGGTTGGRGNGTGGASAGSGGRSSGTGATTSNGGSSNGGSSNGGSSNGGSSNGGSSNGGSSNGGSSSGGTSGTGGGGTGGSGGAPTNCKKGIAANTAPGPAFSPAITWWYNWAMQTSAPNVGVEFVPMVWGSGSLNANVPSGSLFLLGFNEPNFHAQANLTAQEAANLWPQIEAKAAAAGNIPIVGPGMNFCGPAQNCNGTNPYQYYKDFFAACTNCKVDYVAVHWYNCDLPSLRGYIDGNGAGLEGFVQFGKPIWLTEFSCPPQNSVAENEAYMRAAIPYLEDNPNVFRYSWFSAGPIPNARLINGDGTPTALGDVYIGLDENCR